MKWRETHITLGGTFSQNNEWCRRVGESGKLLDVHLRKNRTSIVVTTGDGEEYTLQKKLHKKTIHVYKKFAGLHQYLYTDPALAPYYEVLLKTDEVREAMKTHANRYPLQREVFEKFQLKLALDDLSNESLLLLSKLTNAGEVFWLDDKINARSFKLKTEGHFVTVRVHQMNQSVTITKGKKVQLEGRGGNLFRFAREWSRSFEVSFANEGSAAEGSPWKEAMEEKVNRWNRKGFSPSPEELPLY